MESSRSSTGSDKGIGKVSGCFAKASPVTPRFFRGADLAPPRRIWQWLKDMRLATGGGGGGDGPIRSSLHVFRSLDSWWRTPRHATPFHHGCNPLPFTSPPDKLVVRELAFETRRTSSPRNRFLSSLSRRLNGNRIVADEREREREKVKRIRKE